MKSMLEPARFALLVFVAFPTGVHPQQGFQVKALLQKDLNNYSGRDFILSVGEITIPPGAVGSKHRHPGPTFVYVLEGAVEVELEDVSARVYRAGESFYEEAHQLHISTRNASATEPARILAYHLSRKGEPLTQPEK